MHVERARSGPCEHLFFKSNFNHLASLSPVLIWHFYLGDEVQLFYLHINMSLQQLILLKKLFESFSLHAQDKPDKGGGGGSLIFMFRF